MMVFVLVVTKNKLDTRKELEPLTESVPEMTEAEIYEMQQMLLNISPVKTQPAEVEKDANENRNEENPEVEESQDTPSDDILETNDATPKKKQSPKKSKLSPSVLEATTTPKRQSTRLKSSPSTTKKSAPRTRSPYGLRAHVKPTPKALSQ